MDSFVRIGELARRTGASTHALRVWEDRYRLLDPGRSENGYRHYSTEDERRVREMMRLRAQGVSASDAAARVLSAPVGGSRPGELDALLGELQAAFACHDEVAAHAVIDAALAGYPLEQVLDRVFFVGLRRLGDAWETGEITVAQEHYASGLIRGRMLAIGPDLSRDSRGRHTPRPVAVLACMSDERHDIALLGLDLMLRRDGWRTSFLGADTPVRSVVDLARDVGAGLVVLCAREPGLYTDQLAHHADDLASLTRHATLALAGPAATPKLAETYDAIVLATDPVRAARDLTERLAGALR